MYAAIHIPHYCRYTQKIKNDIAIYLALSMSYFEILKNINNISYFKPDFGHVVCNPILSKRYKPSRYKYFKIKDRRYNSMLF